jgi:hypothetical protein
VRLVALPDESGVPIGEPVPNALALRFLLLPIGKTRKSARGNFPGLDGHQV